jgi:hypothetical protein
MLTSTRTAKRASLVRAGVSMYALSSGLAAVTVSGSGVSRDGANSPSPARTPRAWPQTGSASGRRTICPSCTGDQSPFASERVTWRVSRKRPSWSSVQMVGT